MTARPHDVGGSRQAVLLVAVLVAGVVAAAAVASAPAPPPTLFTFVQLTDRGMGADADQSIWVIRSDGTGLRHLTVACTDCSDNPRFSPDGSWIAYSGTGRDNWSGLFVMRPDGSGKHRLCRLCDVSADAWSPDGRRIAIAGRGITIFTLGVGAREVPGRSSTIPIDSLDWSPDGRWFTFDDGGNRIWIVGSDGRGLRLLTDAGESPRFAPDSRSVVFSVPYPGTGLSTVSIDGGGAKQLVAKKATYATWSTDGRQLAYFGRFGIHIRDIPTGLERQVSIPSRVCRGINFCVSLDWQH